MYRPMPSHAVAIHSTASCVCQVRLSEYGRIVGEREAVGLLAFDLVVRRDRAEQDLREEQRDHQPEILRGRLHRRRHANQRQRIGLRAAPSGARPCCTRVVPAEQARCRRSGTAR